MGIQFGFVGRTTVAAAAIAASVVFAACGSDSSDGGGGGGGAADIALYNDVPASGCGSQPTSAIEDPDGVVAGLPKNQQDAYKALMMPTLKSSWSDFKPKGDPPYTVGLNLVPKINDYIKQVNDTLASSLKASPEIGKVITKTAQTTSDVVGQISNMDALLREKPDIVISVVIQPIPFKTVVDRAAKQGVPVVTFLTPVPSENAVNVQHNIYESIAYSTSTTMRLIGGKGNTMWVNGIPGDVTTDLGRRAYQDAIKLCPDVKDIGQVFGTYTNSIAKRETLTFLATHPQKIAAVGQAASMAPGIMQAFQQSGRPMPIVDDNTVQQGSLGYWRQNSSDYRGVGFAVPPAPIARTAVNVARRMLGGQGVKLNNLVTLATPVTPANLDDWADPDWTLSSNGAVNGPEKDFMSNEYLNTLFDNGAPPK